MSAMNPYTMERWMLERHDAVIRTAELRSRLGERQPTDPFSIWLATNLRHLADRLDSRPRLETASQ